MLEYIFSKSFSLFLFQRTVQADPDHVFFWIRSHLFHHSFIQKLFMKPFWCARCYRAKCWARASVESFQSGGKEGQANRQVPCGVVSGTRVPGKGTQRRSTKPVSLGGNALSRWVLGERVCVCACVCVCRRVEEGTEASGQRTGESLPAIKALDTTV